MQRGRMRPEPSVYLFDAGQKHQRAVARSVCLAAVLCCLVNVAEAKPARCFTTDEGSYPCEFRATDRDGSFQISARGRPTYILNMIERGVASGFVTLRGRNIALPGRYLRSTNEPGCWVSDSTRAKICAR
jgi:hypothetical protein